MNWRHTQLIGLVIILMGCQTPLPKTPPTKPSLKVEVQSSGGMCLSKEDTNKLGIYILELERGYK